MDIQQFVKVAILCVAGVVLPTVGVLALNYDRIVLEDKTQGKLLFFGRRG